MTADNASNNGTLVQTLTTLINEDRMVAASSLEWDDSEEMDPERAIIRCLAHVIHLAVMDMLIVLKAVKKKDVRLTYNIDVMTEAEAEALGGGDDKVEKEAMGLQEEDVDLSSAIQKVCFLARSRP